ncbi:exosortase-dependent surface protein XDP1 [Alteromonas gracilis]|uniref:exosortase-dependent surface protein XDP1 n=1 Tax=Alteromonas gracilis TaxID=1479524 RepID=UPI00321B796F
MRLSSYIVGLSALATIVFNGDAVAGYNSSYYKSNCGNYAQSTNPKCDSPVGEHVYNLVNSGVYEGTSSTSSNVSIGGINVSMTSWADTYGQLDDIVVGANSYKISNYYGYGVTNQDWEYSNSYPDHAIDNVNSVRGNWQDFDFVLFSFSEAVTLQGANFSWVYDKSDTQVSVAALTSIETLTSGRNTWDDIVGNAITSSYNVEKCDSSDAHLKYKSEFSLDTTAKYWLVGAYNKVFGNIGGSSTNDAFKLTSIGFETKGGTSPPTPTEVSEPGTIGILFATGLLIAWRRKTSP